MSPRSQLIERVRRVRGWLAPAALLALVPKCALCVLGYTGLGVTLGLGGPELCGASDAARSRELALPLLGLTLAVAALFTRRTGLVKAGPRSAIRAEAPPAAPTRQSCR